jgi:branched-chain amino acid transport system permease protein
MTIQAATRPRASVHDKAVAAEMRLFGSWTSRIAALLFVIAIVVVPLSTNSPFVVTLGITIGIYAIGAVGLNVLSGYAGQISLGHSFFVGVGAYTAVGLGSKLGLPMPVWLLGAAVVGGIFGLVVGPFALRLRGIYQIVLTLGLVYIGHYLFVNWRSLTGGNGGTAADVPLAIGGLDFAGLTTGFVNFSYEQGLFIVVWLTLAATLLLVNNVVRSRSGRATRAVRDGELAAGIAGINAIRVKVGAFGIAGALGGLAGGLLVAQLRYVVPDQFNLHMALQFITIIIVGGVGTIWGPVIGAAIVCSIPQITGLLGPAIPFLKDDFAAPGDWGIKVGEFNLILYGLILVVFLLVEPRGVAHLLRRARVGITVRWRSFREYSRTSDGGGSAVK